MDVVKAVRKERDPKNRTSSETCLAYVLTAGAVQRQDTGAVGVEGVPAGLGGGRGASVTLESHDASCKKVGTNNQKHKPPRAKVLNY